MTLNQASLGPARSGRAAVSLRRATRAGAAILDWWLRCRSRAAERRALAGLSDIGLRDIGLSRADVESEVQKWPWRP
jgi:uncharacterized protein YjiS (DUF1127 family)